MGLRGADPKAAPAPGQVIPYGMRTRLVVDRNYGAAVMKLTLKSTAISTVLTITIVAVASAIAPVTARAASFDGGWTVSITTLRVQAWAVRALSRRRRLSTERSADAETAHVLDAFASSCIAHTAQYRGMRCGGFLPISRQSDGITSIDFATEDQYRRRNGRPNLSSKYSRLSHRGSSPLNHLQVKS